MNYLLKRKIFNLIVLLIIILLYPVSINAAELALSWTPPTTNADGTPITDLDGYIVYYGTESGNYPQNTDVGDATTYQVPNLDVGTVYYFAVTAYDTSGNESEYSTEKSKKVQVSYYCDNDNDGYMDSSIDGYCDGPGCEPAGCQTTRGNDCNDTNSNVTPGANDSNCSGTDDYDYLIGEGYSSTMKVSNLLFSEDFSNGIPDTWENQGEWDTDNNCNRSIGSPFNESFAIVDSSCSETETDQLITKSFDTSLCERVELSYNNQYYSYSGNIEVETSGDDGTTWTTNAITSTDNGYPTPNLKTLDLSSITETEEARIKFKYSNSDINGYWALDNVQVTCQSNQLTFSDNTQSSALQSMVITNTNTINLSMNQLTIEGPGSSSFSFGKNNSCLNKTLLPGESCMFEILFSPLSNDPENAELLISSTDPNIPIYTVTLTGTGNGTSNFAAPVPEIKVNGSSGTINLSEGDNLSFTVALSSGDYYGENADWWVLFKHRNRWYHYNASTNNWKRGISLYNQAPISDIEPVEVLNYSDLPKGLYTFYFMIDTNMNGSQDSDTLYTDAVTVNIK